MGNPTLSHTDWKPSLRVSSSTPNPYPPPHIILEKKCNSHYLILLWKQFAQLL